MNEQPPKRLIRRPMPGQPVAKVTAIHPIQSAKAQPVTPGVGRSLLQPATAFALTNMAEQERRALMAAGAAKGKVGQEQTSVTSSGALKVPEATLMIMEELTALLTKEMELLKANDVKAINEILPRKHRLIANYQHNVAAIASNPELLQQASDEVRQKLRAVGHKFDLVANQNASALQGAVMGMKRLIKNIIGMIRDETMPQYKTYGNMRLSRGTASAYSPMCPSVAVNRTA